MIQSHAHLEHWRHLLETEIPREMQAYLAKVTDHTVKRPWHAQANQQCSSWTKRLNAILVSPDLPLFQTRYHEWTTAAINGVIADLEAISVAVGAYLAVAQPTAADLAVLQAALAAQISA